MVGIRVMPASEPPRDKEEKHIGAAAGLACKSALARP
jgi:hypothetical protein